MAQNVESSASTGGYPVAKLLVITAISAVLFAGGLIVIEQPLPEFFGDTDFKPFFIPFMLVALLPYGGPSLSVGVGGAMGEYFLDVIEGYEFDDAFGFVGYVLAFGFVFAYFVHKWGDPDNVWHLSLGAIVAAFVQAAFEGAAMLLISGDTVRTAVINVVGNTVTHGVLLGALPLLIIVPLLRGRIERYLGFAPVGEGH